ncbi:hypothetical protein [Paraburkholderia sp. BCC1884]|uniref:hypothetical protein n=1 Tax=Paraburkholderia sp. BCC1884 TaxID=2562668 RepID=UPI0021B4AEFE|nr:hypothetical protein [Paraburkholderia sp. BCC1884]
MRHLSLNTEPALLAVTATVTAACLSIVAGWQRGGWATERALWIAVGVVLVVAAHLLPALCRSHGWRLRILGVALWIGCMAATCYGHAVFFVMAQKHAGEIRAAAVPVVEATGRNLAEIANDRAGVVARLARVTERQCRDRCATVRIERVSLTARLDALSVEAAEAQRAEAAQDQAATARAAAMADPVTGALTAFGLPAAHADLAAGLAFAAVLEGVACFAWLLALSPAVVTETASTPVQQGSNAQSVTPVTEASNAVAAPENGDTESQDDVTRVLAAIAADVLRPTVNEIRKFLGCSQTRAASVRKQLAIAKEQL